ncbi:unnamed protein product [Aphanomyces euteiches]|uniref:Uncharacterized protein n=1 Tax=Aphanomyces euteiches TaxID=100861 RepID=A0A6G0XE96_9STRA|nr:hypothetical protein Ae201684_005712 [Aphanomyces euteiches]KAH9078345.1 hypothetical protein Ae201684P_019436 [Aphanomyces euteiches]KAH9144046.1 hypothetical protein AeRB84_011984 [Aphanomyces euteiches]
MQDAIATTLQYCNAAVFAALMARVLWLGWQNIQVVLLLAAVAYVFAKIGLVHLNAQSMLFQFKPITKGRFCDGTWQFTILVGICYMVKVILRIPSMTSNPHF